MLLRLVLCAGKKGVSHVKTASGGGSKPTASYTTPTPTPTHQQHDNTTTHNINTNNANANRVLLVQHIDDLDDIVRALLRAGGPVSRRQFRDVVTGTLGSRAMSPANINFLFDIFDA